MNALAQLERRIEEVRGRPAGRRIGLSVTVVAGVLAFGLLTSVVVAPSWWARAKPAGLVTAPASDAANSPQPLSTDLPSQAKLWSVITGQATAEQPPAGATPIVLAPTGDAGAGGTGDSGGSGDVPVAGSGGGGGAGGRITLVPVVATPSSRGLAATPPAGVPAAARPNLTPAPEAPAPPPAPSAGPVPTPVSVPIPTPAPAAPATPPPASGGAVQSTPPPAPASAPVPVAKSAPGPLVPAMVVQTPPPPTIVSPVAIPPIPAVGTIVIPAVPCPVLTGPAAGVAAIC